jgi:predicted Zn finger-like uncharacterized protein
MIIECESCKAKFSLDDSRIGPTGVKVKCTKCQNIFVVKREDSEREPEQAPPEQAPPEGVWPEEAPPEEAPPEQAPPEEKPPEVPAEEKPSLEAADFELGFEEERPPEGAGEEPFVSFKEPQRPGAEKQEPGELDFSFDEEKPLEEKEEKAPAGEQAPGGLEFGFEEEKPPEAPAEEEAPGEFELGFEEKRPSEGAGEEPSITFGEPEQPESEKQEPGEFEFSIEEEKPEPPAGEGEEETVPFSIGGEEEEEGAVTAAQEKKPLFAEEEEKEPPPEKEAFESLRKKGADLKKARRERLLTLVAALVLVAAGAFLYLSGTLDPLFKKAPPPGLPGTLKIEKLEGIFADNKHFGKVFALEGRIKNTSDESQQIQAVKGVIYNKQGAQVTSRTVAPGRIISKEELKTLTKAEILKHFKDLSGGFVPPKGTIPVMVVFTELPSDMAQAKIEVIR